MNKKKIKIITYLLTACMISGLILLATKFIAQKVSPEPLPVYQIENQDGTTINTSNILDISDCHVVNAINYTPLEYVNIGQVKHSSESITYKGTYQFLITNLDPMDKDFETKAQGLEDLKRNDDNWHLTMYIPPVYSACNIYVRSRMVANNGALSNYHFNDYITSTLKDTEIHTTKTEPLFLDLTLYSNRKFLSMDSPIRNGVLVTIHYESTNENFSGIQGKILIGKDAAVRSAVNNNSITIASATICSIMLFAILLFVSILKHRYMDFVAQMLFTLGTFGIMFFSYLYYQPLSHPHMVQSFFALSFGTILLGGVFSINKKIKQIPVRIPLLVIAFLTCLVATLIPLVPTNMFQILVMMLYALLGLLVVLIPVGAIFSALNGAKKEFCLGAMICPILMSYALLSKEQLTIASPIFILSLCLLAVTIYISFHEFVITEKRCVYLTTNLQEEVSRKTTELEGIIAERDQLLRYLSHDLKKPVNSIQKCLPFLKANDEQARTSALQNIEHKIDMISDDLIEIQKFAKTNYTPEISSILKLDELLKTIYQDLQPDCEANGIHFKYTTSKLYIFAKPIALTSVIQNLIFNALEHANCSYIHLSAKKEKNSCIITVSDDGKGIDEIQNLFTLYQKTHDSKDNLGLGLYMCKQYIQSMGGSLTYSRIEDESVFTISLPIA